MKLDSAIKNETLIENFIALLNNNKFSIIFRKKEKHCQSLIISELVNIT